MPAIFLTFACRNCKQGRCGAGIWWDIRAINELKEKEFSTRCPVCGNKDIFFGIEAVEVFHGELSALEKLELDEDEMREFDVDNEEDERR